MIERIRVILATIIIGIDISVTAAIGGLLLAIADIGYIPCKSSKYLFWMFNSVLKIARRIGGCSENIKDVIDQVEGYVKILYF